MNRIGKILPVVLIALAPMAMLYPLWSNPVSAGEDDVVYYYPLRKMVGEALREGRWPVDNPLEATGSVLMADPQSAVMHPATWLFAILDAKAAYSLSIFMAFSLAGCGTYLYLRRLALVRPAAAFGAIAMMFSGFMVGHRVHLGMIHTAAMLPWGLWCIEMLREAPSRKAPSAFVPMVPVAYVAITAGHWPTLIYMGLIWFVYLLVRGRPFLRSIAIASAALLLAAAIAFPQIHATAELLGQATRHRIGYATAGENSFFPAAAVLAFFPMLMGSRTSAGNFFPQQWWGPWHLCEMLGYVGLVTLALAGPAVWKLYRRPANKRGAAGCGPPAMGQRDFGPIVRLWTWIAAGALVWMLGYYLPTYRLVHMLPVLGVIRCPARMVLAVDLALAVLASIAIHTLVESGGADRSRALGRAVKRAATFAVPAVMLAMLAAVVLGGFLLRVRWPDRIPFFVGGAEDALAAVRLTNPAVWVPLALAALTALVVSFWLASPAKRTAAIVVLLMADLFFITRFVDVPAGGAVSPDPELSPAAEWLREHAPDDRPFRVWGLSKAYFHRPAELLLPKTGQSLGFATIASYGPFQSPAHSQLLGFRIFGNNENWADLLRRNHLLSLYNVRYILAADGEFRREIESVRTAAGPVEEEGANLLTGRWRAERAEILEGALRLCTPLMWRPSVASQPVPLQPGRVYRIGLDARGPDGGAANSLRAEVLVDGPAQESQMVVHAEQIGTEWRHFEWTFEMPDIPGRPAGPARATFQICTSSERPIEVRGAWLRESHWPVPLDESGKLPPGRRVYLKLVELPPLDPADPPVVIYENLLCGGDEGDIEVSCRPGTSGEIESLKWSGPGRGDWGEVTLPSIALGAKGMPGENAGIRLVLVTLPAVAGYVVSVGIILYLRRRRDIPANLANS